MIRLEITGVNLEEFRLNAANILGLLTASSVESAQAKSLREQKEWEAREPQTGEQIVSDTVVEVLPNPPLSDLPAETPRKRGPKPKVKTAELPDEPIPGFLDRKKQNAAVHDAGKFTKDDIRNRTQEIIAAYKERGDAPNGMVPYVMHLFEVFGIKSAGNLAEDRFAEFMTKSEAYLDGTAKVAA